MQRTSDGGFEWVGCKYIPVDLGIIREDERYLYANAHLFYRILDGGVIVTSYPGIVQLAYDKVKFCGFKIIMSGCSKYSYIYPTINEDGDLYGSRNDYADDRVLSDYECEQERALVVRTLDKISGEYRQKVIAMNISHMRMPFLQDLGFANLVEAMFENCNLVEIPPLTNLRSLRRVSFAHNPSLIELPYDFLKHRVGKLMFLNLINTGVQCIWGRLPGQISEKEEKFMWFMPDQIVSAMVLDSGNKLEIMRTLCTQMAEPAVRAAAAVLLVQSRGVVKGFHRDVARLIAAMILETRGRARWRPVYDSIFG